MMVFALPVLTGGVVIYLGRTGRISRILCLCLLAGTLAAAGSFAADRMNGMRQEVTELPRGEDEQEIVPLTVETDDGTSEQVEIRVPGKKRPVEETARLLEKKASELDTEIL